MGPLLALAGAAAVAAPALAEEVEAGGAVSTTARFGLRCADGCPWLDFRDAAVVAPWIEARPAGPVRARAAVDLRLHGPTALEALEQSTEPGAVQPLSARVRDAWVEVRGDRAELRLGAQRVAWGVAEGIHVVDRLNAWDLEDPTRFDRRLSALGARLLLRRGAWSLEAVGLPFFVPAALPEAAVDLHAQADDVFDADALGAGNVEVGELESRSLVPGTELDAASGAVRLRWTPAWGDLALSWYSGRDSLPQVDGEVVVTGYQTRSRVDVGIPVTWPRVRAAGLELRGSPWGEVDAWLEAALVLPERTVATTSEAQLADLAGLGLIDEVPDPLPSVVTQDGRPYPTWIAGLQRAQGPVVLVAQWLHGFPTERSLDELGDYGLALLRWTPRPALRVELSGAAEVAAAPGWMAGAELGWLVADAAEFELGATWIDGPDGSALAGFREASHVRLSARVAF